MPAACCRARAARPLAHRQSWNRDALRRPPLQPSKHPQDPSGDYVRRWVPELAKLPTTFIHAPWLAPEATLTAAGVRLGESYPKRIVDAEPGQLRAANVCAIREARRRHAAEWSDARGYDLIVAPKVGVGGQFLVWGGC